MVGEEGAGGGGEAPEEYRRLSAKCMVSMYIGNAIAYSVLVAIFILVTHYSQGLNGPLLNDLTTAAIAGLAIILVYMVAAPPVYHSRYRYMITKDKVDVRYGVLILRHIMVPIERVHQVEVSRGPINNLLGLGNVNITTAGGAAPIRYLEIGEAEKIADRLNDLVGAMARGRE